MYVNRLISDLHKKVGSYSYIKKSATNKPCLVMGLNASLYVILPFHSKHYPASHTADVALLILKSVLT